MTSDPISWCDDGFGTPFDREGKVHEEHLKRLIEFSNCRRLDAIRPCGTRRSFTLSTTNTSVYANSV